ncbi:MAG: putative small multi-drug export protein [Elusimicrobia bacterium ADurb.Bin231]|nr:MAG: putative small multi-drug export protein [Elusimicrobia bacterium ADurb.Bin231]
MGVILNALHYFFNKFIIIPVLGFASGLGWWNAYFIAVVIDIVQMFAYFYFLEGAGLNKKIGIMISRTFPSKNSVSRTRMVVKMRKHGYWGIMILAALPVYMGGMYSAVLLSHIMKLKKKKSYIFLTVGTIIGSAILVIGLKAIWILIKSVFA